MATLMRLGAKSQVINLKIDISKLNRTARIWQVSVYIEINLDVYSLC